MKSKNVVFVQDVFSRERLKIVSFFADGQPCRLPLDPAVVVKDVDIEVNSINAYVYLVLSHWVYFQQ